MGSLLIIGFSSGYFDTESGTIHASWIYAGSDVSNWEIETWDTAIANTDYTLVSHPYGGTQSADLPGIITSDLYDVRLRADFTDGTVSDWDTQSITLTPTFLPTVTARAYTDPIYGVNSIHVSWTLPSGVDPTNTTVSVYYQGTTTDGNGWVKIDGGEEDDGWRYDGDDPYANVDIGDGQSAAFRVEINAEYGGFGQCSVVTQSGTIGPAPSVTLTDNHDGTATATWTSVGTNAEYALLMNDQPYGTPVVAAGYSFDDVSLHFGTGMSATFPVQPGDHVYAVVEAILPSSEEDYIAPGFGKNDVMIAGAPLPSSPTNLVATLTNPTTVFLHWFDGSPTDTGFDVYRSPYQDFSAGVTELATTGTDVNQYTDTLPDELTTYYYRVYAFSSVATISDVVLASDQLALGESTQHADGSQGGISLNSVSFSGSTFQAIARDNGTGDYATNQPEWLDNNENGTIDAPGAPTGFQDDTIDGPSGQDHEWPISYMRSTATDPAYMVASPVFKFLGSETGLWLIQGNAASTTRNSGDTTSGGSAPDFIFSGVLHQGSGTLYATTQSLLPNVIDSEILTINWRISMDGGKSWHVVPVGTSSNWLYVTGGSVRDAFQTVLWLGCGGAIGKAPADTPNSPNAASMNQDVIDGVWGKFAGAQTKNVQNQPLMYWGGWASATATLIAAGLSFDAADNPYMLAGLLNHHQGTCGAWASFLVITLQAEGISASGVTITPDGQKAPDQIGVQNLHQSLHFVVKPDLAGQNNPHPANDFTNHAVVEIYTTASPVVTPNTIYDPSYGARYLGETKATAQIAWEAAAVDGVYFQYAFPQFGTVPLIMDRLFSDHAGTGKPEDKWMIFSDGS